MKVGSSRFRTCVAIPQQACIAVQPMLGSDDGYMVNTLYKSQENPLLILSSVGIWDKLEMDKIVANLL